ncbi:hypothetical protein BASA81_005142 [Batrachochytrium salamandrivorans]|nr:hypothetical protein BASA81_005142 [Batrachochytrium salamandrivorans]
MSSNKSEADSRQVWEWLAQAEDSLEKTVLEYNQLAAATDKLERRSVTQEILVRSLRQEKKKKDADVAKLGVEVEALLQLWSETKNMAQQYKDEISKLRFETGEQAKDKLALEILLKSCEAGRAADRQRIADLTQQLAQSQAQTVEKEREHTLQLEVTKDQASAILEWQQAFAVLQNELVQVKSTKHGKAAAPMAAVSKAVPKEQSDAPVAAVAVKPVPANQEQQPPFVSSFKAALRILSKL